jgi:hypothetical protein
MAKKKFVNILKLILLVILSLIWFVFIQVEYEIITKQELQNDFPIIKGTCAVYSLGVFLLIVSLIIIYLLYWIKETYLKRYI